MLTFSYIEESTPGPSTIPSRSPNGGLYTGPQASGPWGNYPVRPDSVDLSVNLLSAENLPPNAEKQPMTFNRPGNNTVIYPYHKDYDPNYNIRCLKQ
jgi:hypothetical protein